VQQVITAIDRDKPVRSLNTANEEDQKIHSWVISSDPFIRSIHAIRSID